MILIIDNYDSFTYNLVHYLGELGATTRVVRNDAVAPETLFSKKTPKGIVLSPGPCDPDKAGMCLQVVQLACSHNIPLLGVCLGHQCIGQAFGGKVVQAPYTMHGKVSSIHHQGHRLFRGLKKTFCATRYHSLIIEKETLPSCLAITATSEDGIIMAVSHTTHAVHGVQFHPESIGSKHGKDILNNFLHLT